jgi:hypothetical protein
VAETTGNSSTLRSERLLLFDGKWNPTPRNQSARFTKPFYLDTQTRVSTVYADEELHRCKIEYFFYERYERYTDTMTTIRQLPPHLQGELYQNIIDEYEREQETPIGRPIKTDFVFETHADILDIIDTCMFLAVDLPDELFHYVASNKEKVFTQMIEYDASEPTEKSFFVTTAEYHALKLLAVFENSLRFPRFSAYEAAAYAIENKSIVLLQYVFKSNIKRLQSCLRKYDAIWKSNTKPTRSRYKIWLES